MAHTSKRAPFTAKNLRRVNVVDNFYREFYYIIAEQPDPIIILDAPRVLWGTNEPYEVAPVIIRFLSIITGHRFRRFDGPGDLRSIYFRDDVSQPIRDSFLKPAKPPVEQPPEPEPLP